MEYLILLSATAMTSAGSVCSGFYTRRAGSIPGAQTLHTFILCIAAALGWGILYLTTPGFDAGVLLYALGFGAFYICGTISFINALRFGPVPLTSLVVQLSSIAVAIWGILFWGSSFNALVAIGFVLVVAALFLCLRDKKQENAEKKKAFGRWIFYTAMAFVGNGGCLIVQKSQQIAFGGAYGNMMMFFAMVMAVMYSGVLYFRGSTKTGKEIVKKGSIFSVLVGVSNCLLNFSVISLASTSLSPNLIYPFTSVGSITITTLVSVLVFKDRPYWWQWIGMGIGIAASVLLSLA